MDREYFEFFGPVIVITQLGAKWEQVCLCSMLGIKYV